MSVINTIHGKLSNVDEYGNVNILHCDTSASDVLIDHTNTDPAVSDFDNLQDLLNKMGSIALRSKLTMDDVKDITADDIDNLPSSIGEKIVDAKIAKDIDDRVKTLEGLNFVLYDEFTETTAAIKRSIPKKEVNDDLTSSAYTWSSQKLSDQFRQVIDVSQDRYDELKLNTNVLKNRLDILTTASDSEVSTDTEIMDIRAGADGETYDSAGNSIRTQINDVYENMGYMNNINQWNINAKFQIIENLTENDEQMSDSFDAINSWFIKNTIDESSNDIDIDNEIISYMNITNSLLNEYNSSEIKEIFNKNKLFNYEDYDIPMLYLTGLTGDISKTNSVTLNYIFKNSYGSCTLLYENDVTYPKKNYIIEFDNGFEARSGWGTHTKYTLKSNFMDCSQARNIVSSRIWGECVKSRETQINETIETLPCAGATDGFPIILIINGEYKGLYTLNIPNDSWLLGMNDGDKEAILNANIKNNNTMFITSVTDSSIKLPNVTTNSSFVIRHVKDDGNRTWITTSLNDLIESVNKAVSGTVDNVSTYLDIDSAIDFLIFSVLISNINGIDNNYNIATYDGVKWFFTPYNLEATFGNGSNGTPFYSIDVEPTFMSYSTNQNNINMICKYLYNYKKEEIKTRYNELRLNILSEDHIFELFCDFLFDIPKAISDQDVITWPTMPGTQINNLNQIISYYKYRCKLIDSEIESL